MKKYKYIFLLHVLLAIYSMSGIVSKYAAQQEFLSVKFCLLYGTVVFILFLYALCWQQIIKKLPLITAYANKAMTVVWGIVWGMLFFDEQISLGKIIGALMVIIGVYIVVSSEEQTI